MASACSSTAGSGWAERLFPWVGVCECRASPEGGARLRSVTRNQLSNSRPRRWYPRRPNSRGSMSHDESRGTDVHVTVQRPGFDTPVELTITRRRITGAATIDYCLVPDTQIGYIYLPSFDDETFPRQVKDAIEAMAASEPLKGLVIDNRMNGGGSSSVAHPMRWAWITGRASCTTAGRSRTSPRASSSSRSPLPSIRPRSRTRISSPPSTAMSSAGRRMQAASPTGPASSSTGRRATPSCSPSSAAPAAATCRP